MRFRRIWLVPVSLALCNQKHHTCGMKAFLHEARAAITLALLVLSAAGSGAVGDGGVPSVPAGKAVRLPFVVFSEKGSTNNHYFPSGWMGNIKAIRLDEGCRSNPHRGATCLRLEYQAAGDWGGVVWQDPENDWGKAPGGWNLTGARKLVFWARGDKGGELVNCFKFGILGVGNRFRDSASGGLDAVRLTSDWKQYSINVADKDLSCIKTGFAWIVVGQGKPVVFYLDDISFE